MTRKKIKLPPKPATKNNTNEHFPEQVKDLTPEMSSYLNSYPIYLRKLMDKVGKKFIGDKATPDQVGQKLDELAGDCEAYIMERFQGLLGLQDLVILFSNLAGRQAGISEAHGMKMKTADYHSAGCLFEAGLRTVAKLSADAAMSKVQIAKKMPPIPRIH